MVASLLSAWRVSLRRTRSDWPVVAAAWVITLLAAALFAAEPMYSSAASSAGLHRTLAQASVAETTIGVSLYCDPAQVGRNDATVRAELAAAIAPLSGAVVRDVRTSATLGLPAGGAIAPGDRAILGSLEGLAEHATLVDGAWPAPPGAASEPLPVVVVEAVADELGLQVHDEIPLVGSEFGEAFTVPVRLVGIFAVRDASDPFWQGDTQLLEGSQPSGASRTFGPFLADPGEALAIPGRNSLHVRWHAYPALGDLPVGDVGTLRRGVEALPDRLLASLGPGTFVATGLPTLLADAERSLLVSRTEVLLIMLQLAVMSGYAILLAASLLVEHRRIDTSLLRSRGAGSTHIALLALFEGLLVAVPAVLLGPWLAFAGLSALDAIGPLAEGGMGLAPRVVGEAYAFAAVAGLICVVLLVVPGVLSGRGFAAEQRDTSRGETRTLGQRLGLDVALVAVAGIALWQLRLYGAPLTRMVQGDLGIDPLLVAAPAVGILSGGIVALRVLPRLARGAETVISRGRNLVGSLGTRQLARRPLRYTRSALLVMLALSMGVFGLSYAATWSGSQRDQAAYQAGAPVRVSPGRSAQALPAWSLPAAYASLPGVGPLTAVERGQSVEVGRRSADLLAIDAGVAPDIVLFRADEATSSLRELMGGLLSGRPTARFVRLPDGTTALRIGLLVTLAGVLQFSPGEEPASLDPASIDAQVHGSAVVRDARGLLYRVEAGPVPLRGPETALELSLTPGAPPTNGPAVPVVGRLDGPLELVSLGVSVQLPQGVFSSEGTAGIARVATGQASDGPWTELPLASAGPWQATATDGGPNVPVPDAQTDGLSVRLGGQDAGAVVLVGGRQSRIDFSPAALGSVADAPVPVIANQAFLESASVTPGETLVASMPGGARQIRIAGVVDAFPTTDPGEPLLIVDEPTLGLLRLQATGAVRAPSEWWMGAAPGTTDGLAAQLRASPFDSASVVTTDGRTAVLRADPIALIIAGALIVGFVASGLFAVVGLMLSAAISARQRRTEFALLRALGLSGRQLSAWLWLENGSLVAVSLLAGTGLGLLIGWLVLPSITVTQQATAPVPPIVVHVPWDQVAVLDLVSAMALTAAVAVTGRLLRNVGVGGVLRMGED